MNKTQLNNLIKGLSDVDLLSAYDDKTLENIMLQLSETNIRRILKLVQARFASAQSEIIADKTAKIAQNRQANTPQVKRNRYNEILPDYSHENIAECPPGYAWQPVKHEVVRKVTPTKWDVEYHPTEHICKLPRKTKAQLVQEHIAKARTIERETFETTGIVPNTRRYGILRLSSDIPYNQVYE